MFRSGLYQPGGDLGGLRNSLLQMWQQRMGGMNNIYRKRAPVGKPQPFSQGMLGSGGQMTAAARAMQQAQNAYQPTALQSGQDQQAQQAEMERQAALIGAPGSAPLGPTGPGGKAGSTAVNTQPMGTDTGYVSVGGPQQNGIITGAMGDNPYINPPGSDMNNPAGPVNTDYQAPPPSILSQYEEEERKRKEQEQIRAALAAMAMGRGGGGRQL